MQTLIGLRSQCLLENSDTKGWTLAPAFDLNPTISRYQGITITRDTNESDLDALLKAAEDYFIPKTEAEGIIKSVKDALKDWPKVAKRLGAQERDINLFSQRFITSQVVY